MKAAIYSRYSTDMQDASSIAGQIANCEALAEANGWQVVERYKDAAISGNDDNRPGYQKLLADSEAALFDVIIVDETSRLTRRAGELPRLLEILAFRNQFLADCKGFDSRQETAALLASVYGGIDSLELRKIKERTHRGLRERSKAGFSAGGKTYGYESVPVDPDDPTSKKTLVIVPEQAEIVVEIFSRYAGGESPRAIADDLNRRKVSSPGSTWKRTKRRTKNWTQSAIVGTAAQFTGILRRELYNGTQVWNRRKSKKVPGTSKRVFEVRPESEWVITENPDLRIVDDLLWKKVQARLRQARENAHPNNKRPRRRTPRYLLSGLMRCGECGYHYVMQDARAYGCSSRVNGGKHACGNGLRVKREVAETVLLREVKSLLLSDETVAYVAEQFRAAVRDLGNGDDAATLEAELRAIQTKIDNVVTAIENGAYSSTLADRLRELEQAHRDAADRLEAAKANTQPLSALPDLVPVLMRTWRNLVENIEGMTANPHVTPGEVDTARNQLRALLGDVTLRPRDGVLWAYPALNAKGLTEASPLHINVVAGAGFKPANRTFGGQCPPSTNRPCQLPAGWQVRVAGLLRETVLHRYAQYCDIVRERLPIGSLKQPVTIHNLVSGYRCRN